MSMISDQFVLLGRILFSVLLIFISAVPTLNAQVLFAENWEDGILPEVWGIYGDTLPGVIHGEGRSGGIAFDAAGDVKGINGAFSRQAFDLSHRPTLSFWVRGQSTKEYWQNLEVSWSELESGEVADETMIGEPLVTFAAYPENTNETFQYCVDGECCREPWRDDLHHNRWQHYRIAINADRTVSFYRDGKEVCNSRTRLDLERLPLHGVEISGQSYLSRQLVDDIVVSSPGDEDERGGWFVWREEGETEKQGSFYTRNLLWSADHLEFTFKSKGKSESFSPAVFYGDPSLGESAQVRVQLMNSMLRVSISKEEQLSDVADVHYEFQPEETYRCRLNLSKKTLEVYHKNTLVASALNPPTHLEAQILPGINKLMLLWLPPENASFSHVRIYRSTDQAEKGQVVADKVIGMTFVDQDYVPGTSYFYRLHPVDKSGNESARAALLTHFRLRGMPTYKPFSDLPKTTGKQFIVLNAKTVFTIPAGLSLAKAQELLEQHTIYTMNPTDNGWVNASTLKPGKGYYVSGQKVQVELNGKPSTEKLYDVPLGRGWNVVGNPFLEPVGVDKIKVKVGEETVPLSQAVQKGWIADYFYGNVEGQWYSASIKEPSLMFPPWRGIYLLVAKDAVLTIPSP